MSTHTFQEHGIVFQSVDQVKRYDQFFSSMSKHGDLYFLLHKFHVPFIPFKLRILKKSPKGKKDKA